MDVDVILSNGAIIIPLIVALCGLYKNIVSNKWHKWTPIVAILLGVLISWLVENPEYVSYKHIILSGLVLGLSSVGLYQTTRSVVSKEV